MIYRESVVLPHDLSTAATCIKEIALHRDLYSPALNLAYEEKAIMFEKEGELTGVMSYLSN